jgi:histidyl-tRNA synthetase
LVEKIWWESTSAAWLWMWIERIINKMKNNHLKIKSKDTIDVFIAQLWHEAKIKCFPIIEKLQNLWISTMWWIWKPSIKWQMRMADKSWAKLCLIMWVIEVRDENIIFRNMEEWRQELVSFKDTVEKVIDFVWKENIIEDVFLNDVFYDETPDEEEIEEKSKRAIRKF